MSELKFDIMPDVPTVEKLIANLQLKNPLSNPDNGHKHLTTLISILKDMDSSLENTSKKLKEFYKELENEPKKSNNIFKKGLDGIKGLKNEKIPEKIGSTFKDLSEIFASDKSTANVMKWTEGFAGATTSLLKGNLIGALTGVGKTISSIIATNRQAEKEIKKFYEELTRAAIAYSVKVIAATKDIKSANDSIFDTDTTNKLSKGMTGYDKAIQKLSELNGRLDTEEMQVGKKKRKFLGVTTGTKKIWDDVASSYKAILGTDKELFDKEKGLDLSIANALLASGKLSDEAKNTITSMVELQTAADAAMKQVNETLTSTAGTLGTDLQTALVSAFKDGTNAADTFGKSVSAMLEKIIADQMFNIIFGEMLKELEDKMKASYSANGDKNITDDIAWFYSNYKNGVEEYNQGMLQMKEQVKDMTGLDVFAKTPSTQSSTSKGFETMTQDQAGELNGRFTALQMSAGEIQSDLKNLVILETRNNEAFLQQSSSLQQLCSVNVQSMYYLEDIKKNTGQLYQINDKLAVIQQNTSKL